MITVPWLGLVAAAFMIVFSHIFAYNEGKLAGLRIGKKLLESIDEPE